jgi:DnaJ-class molecular chaperone
MSQRWCKVCIGSGRLGKQPCEACKGTGREPEKPRQVSYNLKSTPALLKQPGACPKPE